MPTDGFSCNYFFAILHQQKIHLTDGGIDND
jgi:hypothetical protein